MKKFFAKFLPKLSFDKITRTLQKTITQLESLAEHSAKQAEKVNDEITQKRTRLIVLDCEKLRSTKVAFKLRELISA